MKHNSVVQNIERKIFFIRGHKVMLDADLARLYGVTTGNLNLAVKRNVGRFPSDFMFRLTREEAQALILQFARSKGRGGHRKLPSVFTEQGVAMLSSVLNSERAIQINVQIMRTFVRLREIMSERKDLAKKLFLIEKTLEKHGAQFGKVNHQLKELFEIIWTLMNAPEKHNRRIGFRNL